MRRLHRTAANGSRCDLRRARFLSLQDAGSVLTLDTKVRCRCVSFPVRARRKAAPTRRTAFDFPVLTGVAVNEVGEPGRRGLLLNEPVGRRSSMPRCYPRRALAPGLRPPANRTAVRCRNWRTPNRSWSRLARSFSGIERETPRELRIGCCHLKTGDLPGYVSEESVCAQQQSNVSEKRIATKSDHYRLEYGRLRVGMSHFLVN